MQTFGEPLMQTLQKDELENEICKYLKILVDKFDGLKKEDIKDLVIEINNLWEEFIEKENGRGIC